MGVEAAVEMNHYSQKVISLSFPFFFLPSNNPNDHFVFKPILIFFKELKKKETMFF